MRRIGLAVVLAFHVLAPFAAEGQASGKVHTIGLLSPPPGAYVAAFEESLRQLGYVRGTNILFESRSPGGRAELLAGAVTDLLRLKVEVIVAGLNPFIDAAKQATASVPIVMVYGSDPIGRGYISSLARPGGNITGLTWEPTAEILGKHVELLSELSPRPSRVAGMVDLSTPLLSYWKEADYAAHRRGITLQQVQIGPDGDVSSAFRAIVGGRAEAVIVFGSPRLWARPAQISDLARKNALPTHFHVSRRA